MDFIEDEWETNELNHSRIFPRDDSRLPGIPLWGEGTGGVEFLGGRQESMSEDGTVRA
ncbi:MAG: hypothetical protein NVS1B11_08090 [Terriglobales bacterium]